jgi:16S rRNA (guanine527-N7)-methyltransferase
MNFDLEMLLISGLEQLELAPVRILPQLKLYFSELLLWNPKLGLIEASDREIIEKHFLDCAAGAEVFRETADEILRNRDMDRERDPLRIVDLGSGAGLPGIILTLLLKEEISLQMHLVEKQQRRCGFLRNIVPILGLGDLVSIHQCDFQELPLKADIVTSRAFRNLDGEQLALQRSLLAPGGRIIAYKGRMASIETELGEVMREADIIPVMVPGLDDERHMVVI